MALQWDETALSAPALAAHAVIVAAVERRLTEEACPVTARWVALEHACPVLQARAALLAAAQRLPGKLALTHCLTGVSAATHQHVVRLVKECDLEAATAVLQAGASAHVYALAPTLHAADASALHAADEEQSKRLMAAMLAGTRNASTDAFVRNACSMVAATGCERSTAARPLTQETPAARAATAPACRAAAAPADGGKDGSGSLKRGVSEGSAELKRKGGPGALATAFGKAPAGASKARKQPAKAAAKPALAPRVDTQRLSEGMRAAVAASVKRAVVIDDDDDEQPSQSPLQTRAAGGRCTVLLDEDDDDFDPTPEAVPVDLSTPPEPAPPPAKAASAPSKRASAGEAGARPKKRAAKLTDMPDDSGEDEARAAAPASAKGGAGPPAHRVYGVPPHADAELQTLGGKAVWTWYGDKGEEISQPAHKVAPPASKAPAPAEPAKSAVPVPMAEAKDEPVPKKAAAKGKKAAGKVPATRDIRSMFGKR